MSHISVVLRVAVLVSAMAAMCVSSASVAATPMPQPIVRVAMPELVLGGHTPPVDRPVIDPFRLPDAPWLPGNRGIEYDTRPGDLIRATAAGVVVFAGQVGGTLHVTVRHSPELVTTMAFVAGISVNVGDRVAPGDVLAVAGERFHFTARVRGAYINPMLLFAALSYRVRLIPTEPR